MPKIRFKVLHPATTPSIGTFPPQPDSMSEYAGRVHTAGDLPPVLHVGDAVVTGGQRVGDRLIGCNYTTQICVVPGIGEVEVC